MEQYYVKELKIEELKAGLLSRFDRYQKVKRVWYNVAGTWVLKDDPFVEQWSDEKKDEIVLTEMAECVNSSGAVWGVFNPNSEVIGFAILSAEPLGSGRQYLKLAQLHISYGHRGGGIGKKLFLACAHKAKEMGASKLYISGHSSEESQGFYKAVGCVDVEEPDQHSVDLEPYDRQLEYCL